MGYSKCGHEKYWTGVYGTCMCCRAEKAEAEVKELRGAFSSLQNASAKIEDGLRKSWDQSEQRVLALESRIENAVIEAKMLLADSNYPLPHKMAWRDIARIRAEDIIKALSAAQEDKP